MLATPNYSIHCIGAFNRMGGTMRYVTADDRDASLALLHRKDEIRPEDRWEDWPGMRMVELRGGSRCSMTPSQEGES